MNAPVIAAANEGEDSIDPAGMNAAVTVNVSEGGDTTVPALMNAPSSVMAIDGAVNIVLEINAPPITLTPWSDTMGAYNAADGPRNTPVIDMANVGAYTTDPAATNAPATTKAVAGAYTTLVAEMKAAVTERSTIGANNVDAAGIVAPSTPNASDAANSVVVAGIVAPSTATEIEGAVSVAPLAMNAAVIVGVPPSAETLGSYSCVALIAAAAIWYAIVGAYSAVAAAINAPLMTWTRMASSIHTSDTITGLSCFVSRIWYTDPGVNEASSPPVNANVDSVTLAPGSSVRVTLTMPFSSNSTVKRGLSATVAAYSTVVASAAPVTAASVGKVGAYSTASLGIELPLTVNPTLGANNWDPEVIVPPVIVWSSVALISSATPRHAALVVHVADAVVSNVSLRNCDSPPVAGEL